MDTNIVQSMLRTLCYFDVFDTALTSDDLWQYLWQPPAHIDRAAFDQTLIEALAQQSIVSTHGLLHLPGREAAATHRHRSMIALEQKWRIARRRARIVQCIPFCKAIFVCNSLSSKSASSTSDIDIFVVVSSGRLWITRLLITGLLTLTRARAVGHTPDKLCLGFFVSDGALDLSSLRLGDPDIYLTYWISQLRPLYDPDDLFSYITQENSWIASDTPHAPRMRRSGARFSMKPSKRYAAIRYFFERAWQGGYGDMVNREAKRVSLQRMKKNPQSLQDKQDSRVIISDDMLKFHENDRREATREAWKARCQAYGV